MLERPLDAKDHGQQKQLQSVQPGLNSKTIDVEESHEHRGTCCRSDFESLFLVLVVVFRLPEIFNSLAIDGCL